MNDQFDSAIQAIETGVTNALEKAAENVTNNDSMINPWYVAGGVLAGGVALFGLYKLGSWALRSVPEKKTVENLKPAAVSPAN